MNLRRAAAAAAVALGLLASSASAGGTVSLDGARRTKASYSGDLDEAAVNAGTERVRADVDPLMPRVSDCGAGSCDITQLRLTLPKGRTAGWFVATVTAPRSLNLAVGLYDGKGRDVQWTDITRPCCQALTDGCCTTVEPSYTLSISISRLAAGKYTLVVYDRGGVGPFNAKVEYHALPPDRKAPKKK